MSDAGAAADEAVEGLPLPEPLLLELLRRLPPRARWSGRESCRQLRSAVDASWRTVTFHARDDNELCHRHGCSDEAVDAAEAAEVARESGPAWFRAARVLRLDVPEPDHLGGWNGADERYQSLLWPWLEAWAAQGWPSITAAEDVPPLRECLRLLAAACPNLRELKLAVSVESRQAEDPQDVEMRCVDPTQRLRERVDATLASVAAHCPGLTKLVVGDGGLFTLAGWQALGRLRCLRHLDFDGMQPIEVPGLDGVIGAALAALTGLTYLRFGPMHVEAAEGLGSEQCTRELQGLRELHLLHCAAVGDAVQLASKFGGLTSLYVGGWAEDCLGPWPDFELLDEDWEPSDAFAPRVAAGALAALGAVSGLRSLRLAADLGRDGFEAVAAACPHLQTLIVPSPSSSWAASAAVLPELRELQLHSFGWHASGTLRLPFGEGGLVAAAPALTHLRVSHAQEWDLARGDRGKGFDWSGAREHPALQHLSLNEGVWPSGPRLWPAQHDDASWKALESLPALRRLSLTGGDRNRSLDTCPGQEVIWTVLSRLLQLSALGFDAGGGGGQHLVWQQFYRTQPMLRELVLRRCRLTSNEASQSCYFYGASSRAQQLSSVVFDHCGAGVIDESGLRLLTASCPTLRHVRVAGRLQPAVSGLTDALVADLTAQYPLLEVCLEDTPDCRCAGCYEVAADVHVQLPAWTCE